eukprot:CAMPEP_0183485464 /NCGR_PEP_ID=MMETSP0370-20130417/179444_1 /TAXON_ID=268820 /ORGANISM="Peridinium aciculiferum, Strain PAER-2" /LENGTH=133 /DNA_ID=CAMNT_0025678769 /DNA_START=244 /DNA_END=646 /DNA_ORIENTATION=+
MSHLLRTYLLSERTRTFLAQVAREQRLQGSPSTPCDAAGATLAEHMRANSRSESGRPRGLGGSSFSGGLEPSLGEDRPTEMPMLFTLLAAYTTHRVPRLAHHGDRRSKQVNADTQAEKAVTKLGWKTNEPSSS